MFPLNNIRVICFPRRETKILYSIGVVFSNPFLMLRLNSTAYSWYFFRLYRFSEFQGSLSYVENNIFGFSCLVSNTILRRSHNHLRLSYWYLLSCRKKNKAKEYRFIKTTYPVGKDNCTVLDVLLKPMQHMVNMNEMFNDLGFMLLDNEDINCLDEIKRYLTRVWIAKLVI